MLPTNTSRTGRRSLAALAVAACALVPACSGDDDTPDDAPLDTLADEEVIGQAPGGSGVNDVSDGSGEGGNLSDSGGSSTGTAAP